MNILVDDLPEAVVIGGKEYPITTDFRTCVRIILAFEDDDLTMYEKQVVLLQNLYQEEVPEDTETAILQGIKFLDCGREAEGSGGDSLRLYSFSSDANIIYAAFKQTHGIDLQSEMIHWWKFVALFWDLGADTVFCSLTGLRKRVLTGKATKEEKAVYDELGEIAKVQEHDSRTPEEKAEYAKIENIEAGFMERLNRGK